MFPVITSSLPQQKVSFLAGLQIASLGQCKIRYQGVFAFLLQVIAVIKVFLGPGIYHWLTHYLPKEVGYEIFSSIGAIKTIGSPG